MRSGPLKNLAFLPCKRTVYKTDKIALSLYFVNVPV
jgi:hypothetical protein